MSEPVEFIGTMPLVDGVLKAHGDGGFRATIDIPESELAEYFKLHLLRGKVLRFRVTAEGDAEPPRKRKAKRKDDDGTEEEKHGLAKWHRTD